MQEVADSLGVNRRTVYKAIERFGLSTRLQMRSKGIPEPTIEIRSVEPHPIDISPGPALMEWFTREELAARYNGHCVGDVGKRRR